MPRIGSKTPQVGDCSSSWLLWYDEKITSNVKTTNGPDPLKRDQHTCSAFHRAWFGDYCIYTKMRHDELCRSWVTPVSCFHAAPSAPIFKNADRHQHVMRTTARIQVVLPVWLSNQNIGWWHWLVACCPHTTQPTTQASPPQGNYNLSVVENP